VCFPSFFFLYHTSAFFFESRVQVVADVETLSRQEAEAQNLVLLLIEI